MREALIVWGGWAGHEPEQCAAIIKDMLEEDGFKVYVEHSTEAFADPSIRRFVDALWAEAVPTLPQDAGLDTAAYTAEREWQAAWIVERLGL